MKVHWGEQHEEGEYGLRPTQAWLNLRHAKITGTGMVKVMGTPSAHIKYIEGIAWAINRMPADAEAPQRMSADMRRGNELEPFAAIAIEERFPITQQPCMFIDITDTAGISPDFVDIDLTVAFEIKCLQAEAAAEVIYSQDAEGFRIPKKHRDQCIMYFMIPTIKTVTYTIFVPAVEMANGEDFLHMITLYRHDCIDEIANMQMALISADLEIKNLRSI